MDLLSEGTHPLAPGVDLFAQRVDLLGEVGVLGEQVALELRQLVSVRRRGFLVGLVGPRLCLLGDDHQRTGVERDAGEDEVQQDPRARGRIRRL